jgi:phosphate uptake regulator
LQEQLESIAESLGSISEGYQPLNVKTQMSEEDYSNMVWINRNLERIADSLQAIERTLHKDKNKDKNK